jgi:hypothetical protein
MSQRARRAAGAVRSISSAAALDARALDVHHRSQTLTGDDGRRRHLVLTSQALERGA